ncbi:hypothetical protein NEISICOT_00569 [Neisseria sicca ATCC 29256]|uniref:Uncharacterized protein n=1 Tax=Neisseria sicca ATCC 29256 TaxID=547045 RepID=C6M231_NEISI|nr:hypothetical protein NEISICOT_00569 [Neisseria sicca ATCC 29256]
MVLAKLVALVSDDLGKMGSSEKEITALLRPSEKLSDDLF